jgi:hypothetical protein
MNADKIRRPKSDEWNEVRNPRGTTPHVVAYGVGGRKVDWVDSLQAEDFIRLVHDGLAVGIAQGKFGIAQF